MSDLQSFFTHYAELYMASDVDAVTALYEAPFLAVREGHPIHLRDREAVRDHLAGLMDAYRQSGAARADVASFEAKPLGQSSVNVTVHWHIVDANGGVVRDLETTYQLLRDPNGWKILSYTNHD